MQAVEQQRKPTGVLTLYRFTGATCAAKVLIALHEKAIRFEDRVLSRDELTTPEYRRLNPKGVVPTVTHDGFTITESSVILHYLEDAFDAIPLHPRDALSRARVNHWLKVMDDSLTALGTVTYAIYGRKHLLALSISELERYFANLVSPHQRMVRRQVVELGLSAPEVPDALRVLTELQVQADYAARCQEYLVGSYGLADVALTPFVLRLDDLGLLASQADLPHLHRWWDAIQLRPSFAEAIVRRTPPDLTAQLRAAGSECAIELEPVLASMRSDISCKGTFL